MKKELKDILISYKQPDFIKKLQNSRTSTIESTFFSDKDGNRDKVKAIVEDISKRGDIAVAEYTEKFDKVKLAPKQFRVSVEDLKKAHSEIDKSLLVSIRKSISNVRKYQKEIFIGKNKICSNGTGIKYTPIERIGICVPGASAPLPSTVIMTAVPAQVAGVKEIVVVSPPRYNGSIHPVILAVCHELNITEVYRIGGVQAVAALARGYKEREKVDKIVGPGNAWVQMAKREVFGLVDIDSIAGPSEVLVIANDSANPVWVAADMLSQVEHNPGSATLFTDSHKLAEGVLAELEKQANKLSGKELLIESLINDGNIIVFENIDSAIDLANLFATEHLQIQCGAKSQEIAEKIQNAGAIFIGNYTPVATGDYFAGPSHTLPTGITARFFSALSSNDFVKSTSIIEYSKDMLAKNAGDIIRLAEAEGLDGHAKSVKIRIGK
ncbi:MAG: histidinol dehydrogenase [Planctomycetes bacterium]|nr:histidinol dehydrogenase [Planctomycetota bacterium]MBU1517998.1 histidinol dehydrogenase [Planctomycetota bacterium]MBU2457817.1 histidinol dehydrogenase [Planctomycetota bacterium]MBU2595975.1 histidinol dehydrogenase [Planctomycetota bacterium]